MDPVSALLLINKPSGVTSFSSLSPVKRHVNKKTGHAGTLDKFANGLMIVLTGSFTKLNPIFSSLDKSYRAVIELGKETDTLDPEGDVIATADIPSREKITEVINTSFLGTISQRPPLYSAIHINGKRAHSIARSGRTDIVPDARPVTIHSIEIVSFEGAFLTLDISCSKGTYIRSLARDIAQAADSRGYVTELQRTRIGPYVLSDAVSAERPDILREHASGSIERLQMLPSIGSIVLGEDSLKPLSYGRKPEIEEYLDSSIPQGADYALVYNTEKKVISIAQIDQDTRIVKNIMLAGGN